MYTRGFRDNIRGAQAGDFFVFGKNSITPCKCAKGDPFFAGSACFDFVVATFSFHFQYADVLFSYLHHRCVLPSYSFPFLRQYAHRCVERHSGHLLIDFHVDRKSLRIYVCFTCVAVSWSIAGAKHKIFRMEIYVFLLIIAVASTLALTIYYIGGEK